LGKLIEIDPSLEDVQFFSDSQRLSQVFVNLVSNSLKFTFNGYIKFYAKRAELNSEEEAKAESKGRPLIVED
jgi:signal transduction histidine kinase